MVKRSTRCAPESCHAKLARASPGHGSPPGGVASRDHSPTSTSSLFSAFSAVGWFIPRSKRALRLLRAHDRQMLLAVGRGLVDVDRDGAGAPVLEGRLAAELL